MSGRGNDMPRNEKYIVPNPCIPVRVRPGIPKNACFGDLPRLRDFFLSVYCRLQWARPRSLSASSNFRPGVRTFEPLRWTVSPPSSSGRTNCPFHHEVARPGWTEVEGVRTLISAFSQALVNDPVTRLIYFPI
jgi:hypothetical protein